MMITNYIFVDSFVQLGFNEAYTFKSSSMLIYYMAEQIIYAHGKGLMPWIN
jgi:hypothetical protein